MCPRTRKGKKMGNSLESRLHEAVHLGQVEKAQLMMEERRKKMKTKCLNPNEVHFDNPERNTLLMSAASGGFEDVFTELADMELNCGVKNCRNQNLLHILCKWNGRAEGRVSETHQQNFTRRRMLERTLSHLRCKPHLPQLLTEKDQVSKKDFLLRIIYCFSRVFLFGLVHATIMLVAYYTSVLSSPGGEHTSTPCGHVRTEILCGGETAMW